MRISSPLGLRYYPRKRPHRPRVAYREAAGTAIRLGSKTDAYSRALWLAITVALQSTTPECLPQNPIRKSTRVATPPILSAPFDVTITGETELRALLTHPSESSTSRPGSSAKRSEKPRHQTATRPLTIENEADNGENHDEKHSRSLENPFFRVSTTAEEAQVRPGAERTRGFRRHGQRHDPRGETAPATVRAICRAERRSVLSVRAMTIFFAVATVIEA